MSPLLKSTLRWTLVIAPLVGFIALAWSRRWVAEDAFINFRVIENLLDGNGLVFNVGERVEAGTSPLWIFVLAAVHFIFRFVSLEWTSVIVGLAGTTTGIVCAQRASLRLWSSSATTWTVPIGVLILIGTVPMWDFATSGLETGLSFAWFGASWLLLVRLAEQISTRRTLTAALVISLATMIRPDFGLFWVPFGMALLWLVWRTSRRLFLLAVVGLALIPVAFEIFRMGYFAALAPNTALAKDAADTNFVRGSYYLNDLLGPYLLLLPLFLALAIVVLHVRRDDQTPITAQRRRYLVAIAAPLIGAMAHGGYIVMVGGDYMHGRLLLPALFALLMPVMAIRIAGRLLLIAAVVLAWSIVSAAFFRPAYAVGDSRGIITNERVFWHRYVAESNNASAGHLITLNDRWTPLDREQIAVLESLKGTDRLVRVNAVGVVDLGPGQPTANARLYMAADAIGWISVATGRDTWVIDRHGLADPFAARFAPQATGRTGHAKELDDTWLKAIYGEPSPDEARSIREAREALACGDLRDLRAAVREPLSFDRFTTNLTSAVSLWRVEIPADPSQARVTFCRS